MRFDDEVGGLFNDVICQATLLRDLEHMHDCLVDPAAKEADRQKRRKTILTSYSPKSIQGSLAYS